MSNRQEFEDKLRKFELLKTELEQLADELFEEFTIKIDESRFTYIPKGATDPETTWMDSGCYDHSTSLSEGKYVGHYSDGVYWENSGCW